METIATSIRFSHFVPIQSIPRRDKYMNMYKRGGSEGRPCICLYLCKMSVLPAVLPWTAETHLREQEQVVVDEHGTPWSHVDLGSDQEDILDFMCESGVILGESYDDWDKWIQDAFNEWKNELQAKERVNCGALTENEENAFDITCDELLAEVFSGDESEEDAFVNKMCTFGLDL